MSKKIVQICLFLMCAFVVACASKSEMVTTSGEESVPAARSDSGTTDRDTDDSVSAPVSEPVIVEESLEMVETSGESDESDGWTETSESEEAYAEAYDAAGDSVDGSVVEGDYYDDAGDTVGASADIAAGSAALERGGGGGADEVAMVRPIPESEPESAEEFEDSIVIDEPEIEPEMTESPMIQPQSGLLTAGDIDDNLNLDSFTEYINNFAQNQRGYPFLTVGDRFEVVVVDENDRPVKQAEVAFGDSVLRTTADGKVTIYPALDGIEPPFTVRVTSGDQSVEQEIDSPIPVQIVLEGAAESPQIIDLAFVIDTTGSMGDELRYLQVEFESIVQRVQNRFPDADMRFGLTLYRDSGDAYVVESYRFTNSVAEMQAQLNEQNSDGGGDYEEAVERGLEDSLAQNWRDDATQILFLVADAPPHFDKLNETWEQAVEARSRGIIINTLASSGVDEGTEYMMRSMAALTHGRHLFLTDDSGVGGSHKEPTIPCYVVTPLNDLMVRVISSQVLGERIEAVDENIRRTSGEYVDGVCQ